MSNLKGDILMAAHTSMHRYRHLAAASKGDGVCVVVANSNSKIDSGDVMKRRRWFAMVAAMSGKLNEKSQYLAPKRLYVLYLPSDQYGR